MPTAETITRAHIDELLAFRPNFAVPDREYVIKWRVVSADYATDVNDFFHLAGRPVWQDRGYQINEAGEMLADDDIVAAAGLEQIKTMLTFCVRGERFSTGHWEYMLKTGRISALLDRLEELRETVPEA
jgi:hypothetical protein